MTVQDDISQVRSDRRKSNMFESKSDSALLKRSNGEVKLNCSSDNISLSITCKKDNSVADVPNAKLKVCQLFSSESRLSYDDELFRNSHSHYLSASLPTISSLNSYLGRNQIDTLEKDVLAQGNAAAAAAAAACTDEEETLFNRLNEMKRPSSNSQCSINEKIIETSCQGDSTEEQIAECDVSETKQICEETANSQLRVNDNKTTSERNQVEVNKKDESSATPLSRAEFYYGRSVPRPTLVDDSKLVKMSLLTNPMNIMQSNVQLLNKSRLFLNFITEKSTNIMEKALLPQHLAMRYNHISKSIETDAIDAAGFCTNNSALTNVTSRLYTDSATNRTNTTDCIVKQNHGKSEDSLDSIINNEKEANPSTCMKRNKIYDDSIEQLLYDNNLENEISDEKKYRVLKNNDFGRLDCDVIAERVKRDVSSAETEENKSFLQTDELYDDAHKGDSSDISALVDSNIVKYGSLEHPLNLTLLEDYTSLKLEHSKLLERMEYLKKLNRSNNFQETEMSALILQVENLQKTVNKLTDDLNTSLDTQEALKKECTAISKEKENMVMRYVTSEKQLIDMQRYL